MLVTVPAQRATLTEVLNHPWILKGFTAPPAAHIPTRVPLRFGELDDEVIRGMTGFEFGTEAEISSRLGDVIQSDLYRQAVRNWEARGGLGGSGGEGSSGASDSDKERPAMRVDGRDMKRTPTGNKRFSGLGFYGKKLTSGFNAAFAGATAPPARASDDPDGLGAGGGGGGGAQGGSYGANGAFAAGNGTAPRPEQLDPTRGFHPLISIYYLVKEKIERERIWGPGVFASSTLSLTGPPPPPAPAQAYQAGSGTPVVAPPPSSIQVDSARPPMPTPPVPLTPQPRQRATGDEYAPVPATAPPRAAAGFDLSQPSSASKRASYAAGGSPAVGAGSPGGAAFRPQQQADYEAPVSPSPRERKSSAANRMSLMLGGGSGGGSSSAADRERERVAEIAAAGDDVPLAQAASGSSPGPFARRFGSLLGRSSSVSTSPDGGAYSKGHRQRASIATVGHKAGNKTAASPLPLVTEATAGGSSTLRPPATPTPVGRLPSSPSDEPLASPPDGKPVVRASTVGDISPSRHQRGVSMAAGAGSPLAQSVASSSSAAPGDSASVGRAGGGASFFDRRRQGSVGGGGATKPPRPKTQNDIAGMFEEEEELAGGSRGADGSGAGRAVPPAGPGSPTSARQDAGAFGQTRPNDKASSSTTSADKGEGAKPVWLKGLFSVSTTTTKPINTLRADLVQVLDRLGVQHRDVKNGFECAHVPSIDLSSVGGGGAAGAGGAGKGKRDTLKRRASKLLLSHGSGHADGKQPSPSGGAADSQQSLPTSTTEPRIDRASSSSFHQPLSPPAGSGAAQASQPGSANVSPQQVDVSQFGGPSNGAAAGNDSDMIVRFEIFLIKMPLLPGIHGLQFRRIAGSAWQYQVLGASPCFGSLFLCSECALLTCRPRLCSSPRPAGAQAVTPTSPRTKVAPPLRV